jgi:hypothetical protein
MFGLFGKKLSINEYAKQAEILPVAEEGDYKAFIIQIQGNSSDFSSALQKNGGQLAVTQFVEIIERRITDGDYDNIFDVADQMMSEYGMPLKQRNTNVERMVICSKEKGYLFKWSP